MDDRFDIPERQSLKSLIAKLDGRLLVAVGVANGAEARTLHHVLSEAEDSGAVPDYVGGFIVYVSGYLASAERGLPDLGLGLREEIVRQTDTIEQAGAFAGMQTGHAPYPIAVDIDTGYGNEAAAVLLTCRQVHKQGAQCVQIEDQFAINKSCGHMDGALGGGKPVIDTQEMLDVRLAPCLAFANSHEDLCVVARTDARGTFGLEHAVERAHRYCEAGPDFIFVEAPQSNDELETVARELASHSALNICNVVESSPKTPVLSPREVHAMGFDLALFPVGALLGGHAAQEAYYRSLLSDAPAPYAPGADGMFDALSDVLGRKQVSDWNRRFRERS